VGLDVGTGFMVGVDVGAGEVGFSGAGDAVKVRSAVGWVIDAA